MTEKGKVKTQTDRKFISDERKKNQGGKKEKLLKREKNQSKQKTG